MTARLLVLCLAAAGFGGAGCSCGGPAANPPPPPTPLTPPDGAASLPTDDAGRPILLSAPVEGYPDLQIQLVYDASLDNPVVRRGECLSRVLGCYDTNPGPISGCITQYVEKCPDNTGGMACCAPACIQLYQTLHQGGASEEDALEQAFVVADCLQGYSDYMDGGQP